MNLQFIVSLSLILSISFSCKTIVPLDIEEERPIHIVFVMGDEEYRSEESMPMLGHILKREMNAKISLCYPLDSNGIVDPNRNDHIDGLEALETADLMVLFTRWRALPEKQLKLIVDYANSGKPMVGFRTTTHAFLYKEDKSKGHMNNEWPTRIFGQQWITHHGHFEDGDAPLTQVDIVKNQMTHPILNGVQSFDAYSWLYHVQGGGWHIYGHPEILLTGTSLRSQHQINNRTDVYPMTNPVAWTKHFGKSKVFFTTLGHPYDFLNSNMRKLALNGIFWALDKEHLIPLEGVNADLASQYIPNNSGFGQKFKQNMKPIKIE